MRARDVDGKRSLVEVGGLFSFEDDMTMAVFGFAFFFCFCYELAMALMMVSLLLLLLNCLNCYYGGGVGVEENKRRK